MLAVKSRHAAPLIEPVVRIVEPIRVIGAAPRPQSSTPRDMHELLEARLAAPATPAPRQGFSPFTKLAIVTALAVTAWVPVAAAAWAFS